MPPHADPLRLAELIAARISHDLSGAVSMLTGALDLAAEKAPNATEPLSLAAEAADELTQRIRLLRAAWGPTGDPLDLPGLRALARGLPGSGRLRIGLTGLPGATVFAPGMARVVLNLLLLAREALPAGGEVALAGIAEDVVISIAGPRAAWPAGLARSLANEANAWAAVADVRTLQMPLTALLARSLGLRLSLVLPAGGGESMPMLRLSES